MVLVVSLMLVALPALTPATVIAPAEEARAPIHAARGGGGAAGALPLAVGPDVIATTRESYAEAAGGERTVYYFDKSRVEIHDPGGDRDVAWFLTTGPRERELVTGEVQVGDQARLERAPAVSPLAGDGDDHRAPTYATLGGYISRAPGDQWIEPRLGQPVTTTLAADGRLGEASRLGQHAVIAAHDTTLGHDIPDGRWEWMTMLEEPWFYVPGAPISESPWGRVRVAGAECDVLVQVFEWGVVISTPHGRPGWRVEMGNVGLHYYQWRHERGVGS